MRAKTAVLFYWLHVVCVLVFADDWKVKMEPEIQALVKSCVVLPCSFTYPGTVQPSARKTSFWHNKRKWDEYIYHPDERLITDNFKGRTKPIGRLGDLNCSLEIDDVRGHDNGPFCFRVELDTSHKDKYSFMDKCVNVQIIEEAAPPELQSDGHSVQEGHPAVFRCSVRHTCPSHQPSLTWNHAGKEMVTYKDISHGNWEVESILTFTPTKEDSHTDITCTVSYHGLKSAFEAKRPIFVKEQASFNHIVIPAISGLGAALLVGVLCFFIVKRYKRRIEDLQSRNDNGMWSRLSRMSRRFRSGGNSSGPDGRNQRRSIWSRFSRRVQGNQTDRNFDNRLNKPASSPYSKPRMPSPKSQPKFCSGYDYDDDYTNTAELNIYGNA